MAGEIDYRVLVEQMTELDLRASLNYLATSLNEGKLPNIFDYASIFLRFRKCLHRRSNAY